MRLLVTPSLLIAAALMPACDALTPGDTVTAAPLPVGRVVAGTAAVKSTSVPYKIIGEASPIASKGTVGFAEDCDDASASSGTLTIETLEERRIALEVVGETVSDHPLVPGPDTFGKVGISVVSEQVSTSGSSLRRESFYAPDADTRRWDEEEFAAMGPTTAARYKGVARDEYLVELFPLDVWESIAGSDTGLPVAGANNVTLLTKSFPVAGDAWTSVGGGIVYRFDGTEALNVAGKTRTANRVQVFVNGNFDATAGNVLDRCISLNAVEDTTTFPDENSVLTQLATLDAGCEGSFLNQQVGTEWWVDGFMVRFVGKRAVVSINSYGWEWTDRSNNSCTRMTSIARPTDDDIDATLFVEYGVTLEQTTFAVDTWTSTDSSGLDPVLGDLPTAAAEE